MSRSRTAENLFGPDTDVRLQGGEVALITEVAPIDEVEFNSQRVASDVLFQVVFIDGRAMVRARAVVAAR